MANTAAAAATLDERLDSGEEDKFIATRATQPMKALLLRRLSQWIERMLSRGVVPGVGRNLMVC